MYLEINNLVKSYVPNTTIIRNLSLSMSKGEIMSFIGESGSGKSTFLKCLSGLEKINSGSIKLNGRVINDENVFVKPQNRNVGFVFQDYPLFPHLNLYNNITFNLSKEFYEKINYIIDLTNLKNLLKRYPYELSGGEQQRACIARALVREPDLLLLDEPFSNLDKSIKKTIKDEIHNIISETKTTSILVTHDINDSLDISDKILIFKAGLIQQFDDPVKMYCEPANCYCAEILGDLNKIKLKNKEYFIRPEKLKICTKSNYEFLVHKSSFQGKNYIIEGELMGQKIKIFSEISYKKNEIVFIDFNKNDLIYFDSLCKSYFR
tara:strand:- start:74409 stop:75371 length:963 start_codon:yes stop_codon:yes gene_type:complete